MAQLTQKGLVDFVGKTETRQYKDKTFVSRVIVLEQPRFDAYTGEKLGSNYIKFEATREETCTSLDNFPVGSKVEVEFIVRGSKYAKKDGTGDDVFTRLELRSITMAGSAPVAQTTSAGAKPLPAAAPVSAPMQSANQTGPTQDDYDPDLGF